MLATCVQQPYFDAYLEEFKVWTVYTFLNHADKYRQWTNKIDTASKIEGVVVMAPSQIEIVSWLFESCITVINQDFITCLENIKINTKESRWQGARLQRSGSYFKASVFYNEVS